MLIAIARTVEHRDPETGNHCERLAKLGEAFGRFLNRSSDEIKTLIWGGYLHDIGKIAIPDAILLKRDRLTPPWSSSSSSRDRPIFRSFPPRTSPPPPKHGILLIGQD